MFDIGDLIIYSGQGICRIDAICEKTYLGVTKDYYVLHPVENKKLEISIPVDNDKVKMLNLMPPEEAEEMIESFKLPGIEWIEVMGTRAQTYSDIVKHGNRRDIAKLANTLMRKKRMTEGCGRRFHEKDKQLLTHIQHILFAELAISLTTTYEEIARRIDGLINEQH